MDQQLCHSCGHELSETEQGFRCAGCGAGYAREALCPECRRPLQVLKACGAVDYFCRHGHGLISKKRVAFVPATGPA